jgi:hypothetical protein
VLEQVVANCGAAPAKSTADACYSWEDNVAEAKALDVDPVSAPGWLKRDEQPPRVRGRPPADLTAQQTMARKLATRAGDVAYAQRQAVVEPVFGQRKQARGLSCSSCAG